MDSRRLSSAEDGVAGNRRLGRNAASLARPGVRKLSSLNLLELGGGEIGGDFSQTSVAPTVVGSRNDSALAITATFDPAVVLSALDSAMKCREKYIGGDGPWGFEGMDDAWTTTSN